MSGVPRSLVEFLGEIGIVSFDIRIRFEVFADKIAVNVQEHP
jgi:hypothetical protein